MHIALTAYVYSPGEAQRKVALPHKQKVIRKTEKGIPSAQPNNSADSIAKITYRKTKRTPLLHTNQNSLGTPTPPPSSPFSLPTCHITSFLIIILWLSLSLLAIELTSAADRPGGPPIIIVDIVVRLEAFPFAATERKLEGVVARGGSDMGSCETCA